MPIVPMKKLLDHAIEHGYAVPSFCVWNTETMAAVVRVATRMRAPIILMAGECEYAASSPGEVAATARGLVELHGITTALHLDHGGSVERARECLDAGYSSLMLDYSARPYDENVAALKEVVTMAHPADVTVEGELGAVGKVGDETAEGAHPSTLTDPDQAADFVSSTGIDCLAVSIGNAHGHYTALPKLDFDRLERIHRSVSVPLVLHGGSGTPDSDISRAIGLGIAKVNVATALVKPLRESLMRQWQAGERLWIPEAVGEAMKPVREAVAEWIVRVGAEGKAQR
ncbi:MAG: ketose-bisphosphate aldolase [Chitinivibrionales bacterium]|nr:ketose-bisphosphate aldolase [Chitinivibrionales bacterium]